MNTETQQKLRQKISDAIRSAEDDTWILGDADCDRLAEAVLEALQIEEALPVCAEFTEPCGVRQLMPVFRLRVLEEGQ